MAAILHKEFAENGWPKISDGSCWDGMKAKRNFDHSRAETVLGIKFEPDFSKVLIAMVYSMLATGALVRPKL